MERARGTVRIALAADGATTRLVEAYQAGSAKVRFPRTHRGDALDATLINTAGGVTGGDHLTYAIDVGAAAAGVIATQAAERIYRRSAGVGRIDTTLSVAANGRLDWLPQETIVFDGAALARTMQADVDPSGRLLAVESVVLGRTAMGERATDIHVTDAWRIRRGGELVFADTLRLEGDAAAIMAGGATGNGAVAIATLVLVAPDAEGPCCGSPRRARRRRRRLRLERNSGCASGRLDRAGASRHSHAPCRSDRRAAATTRLALLGRRYR